MGGETKAEEKQALTQWINNCSYKPRYVRYMCEQRGDYGTFK